MNLLIMQMMIDDYEPMQESLLDGDFSCETTEEEL